MRKKKTPKTLRITETDYLLANRRAARQEEIDVHGKPVSFRTAFHKSRKVYDRKRLKKAGIKFDDLPSFLRTAKIVVRAHVQDALDFSVET